VIAYDVGVLMIILVFIILGYVIHEARQGSPTTYDRIAN
jgi:hypothetical protein